jgi:hypothetical protein
MLFIFKFYYLKLQLTAEPENTHNKGANFESIFLVSKNIYSNLGPRCVYFLAPPLVATSGNGRNMREMNILPLSL